MFLKVLYVREEVMDVFGISLNVSIMHTSLLKKIDGPVLIVVSTELSD